MTVLTRALWSRPLCGRFTSRHLRSLSKSLPFHGSFKSCPLCGHLKPPLGIEPKTFSLQVKCSTAELKRHGYHHPGCIYYYLRRLYIIYCKST
jgi:hypothetical protein